MRDFLKLARKKAAPPLECAARIKWRYLLPTFLLSLYLAIVVVRITRVNLMSCADDLETDSIDVAIFGLEPILPESFTLTVRGFGFARIQSLVHKTRLVINSNKRRRYLGNLPTPPGCRCERFAHRYEAAA